MENISPKKRIQETMKDTRRVFNYFPNTIGCCGRRDIVASTTKKRGQNFWSLWIS
jgi:hypothetical protein